MRYQVIVRNLGWTAWALVPVGLLAFHFGPGQHYISEDRADRLLTAAHKQRDVAQAAQDEAYSRHIELLGMRSRLREADKNSAATPNDKASLDEAVRSEKAAYSNAAEQWRALADQLAAVEAMLRQDAAQPGADSATSVRIAKARAMIRGGLVNTGIDELEETLNSLEEQPSADASLVRQAREELATGHYYNARLMRVAGHAPEEWKLESSQARQQYRYLAETARDDVAIHNEEAPFQLNVERVLNLEQSSSEDLLAKPLPRNAPESRCQSDKECNGKCKGKKKGKINGPPDSRGAGTFDGIGPGW